MKKLLILALMIIVSTIRANAQVVTSAEVKSKVSALLTESYKKSIDADIEVKVSATPFAQLQLPDGEITYKIVQGGNKIIPRDIKRVDLYVNKAFIQSINLPTQTVVYKDVLVASDFINREQAITKDVVMMKKIDISQKLDYVLSDNVLNKEMSAKKAFQKGEIIDKRFVKMKPDVVRNEEIRVFFVSNGSVMITINGIAMSDGMTGDYISVENKKYKKTYTGKVIGENRVLVNI